MRRLLTVTLHLFIVVLLMPATKSVAQSQESLKIVLARNYYFLSLLENGNADLKNIFTKDSILQRVTRNKADSLPARAKACGRARNCFVNLMQFSDTDISKIGERVQALWKKGNELDRLLVSKLMTSGAYGFKADDQASPADFLRKAWEQDARGINYAIQVYGNARRPNYPNIDSVDFQ